MDVFGILLGAGSVLLWLAWFWRLRMNAEAFAPGTLRYGPGMAIGAWFVPVGALFLPKQVANDIWTASAPSRANPTGWYGPRAAAARRGLLNGWWTMWVIYLIFGGLFSWQTWHEASTLDDAKGWLGVGVITDFFGIPATILAIIVVLRLSRHQENRLAGRT